MNKMMKWGSHEPPARLLRKGFVVVTFNYRLGALGFLCLRTPNALGNTGLKDHVAALYWIQRNIENFGGNPDEVTVHGVGSAGASVQLLLLSGVLDGLVHRVLLESGSILSPLSMTYDPQATAYEGARSIGYTGDNDAEELYNFYEETKLKDLISIPDSFLPCVENATHSNSLIDFDPIHKLKDGNYHKIPTMITYTNTINDNIGNETESLDTPLEYIINRLPSNLEFDNDMVIQKVGQIVKEFYFGNDILDNAEVEQNYFDYNYDIYVEYPVVKFAMLYAANSPHMVYLMKFTVDGQTSPDESSVISFGTILDNLYRGRDNDDIILKKLIALWGSFIEMSDPTPLTTSLIPVIWHPVITDKEDRLAIGNVPTFLFDNKLKMAPSQGNQRLIFWDNIYSRFYKPHYVEQEEFDDLDDHD